MKTKTCPVGGPSRRRLYYFF